MSETERVNTWGQTPGYPRARSTLFGLVVTALLHGGLIAAVVIQRAALNAEAAEAPKYVVAKLVRLGKPRDKKLVPNKVVAPPVQAEPPKPVPIDPTPEKPKAVKEEKPSKRAERKRERPKTRRTETKQSARERLDRALARAETLAKADREIEQEGQLDGVPTGTVDTAEEGDRYMTRIADLWNRAWSLPAIIPRDEAKELYVLIVLRIDRDGQIQFPIRFDRRSGNVHFDSSVTDAWKRIGALPLPPPDRLARILANGLALKLNWRGLS